MDDKEIARKYLITSLTIKNLELDLQHVQNGPFKIKEPYVQLIEGMISKVINERRKLKKIMHERKIQVEFLYKQGHFTTYKFVLNGNVKEMPYMNQKLKRDVEEMIRGLMKK